MPCHFLSSSLTSHPPDHLDGLSRYFVLLVGRYDKYPDPAVRRLYFSDASDIIVVPLLIKSNSEGRQPSTLSH